MYDAKKNKKRWYNSKRTVVNTGNTLTERLTFKFYKHFTLIKKNVRY